MQTTSHKQALGVILCYAFAGWSLVGANTDFFMMFNFRNTTNGPDLGPGTTVFANAYYTSSDDCPAHHRTPDGLLYEHGHTYEVFPFSVWNTQTQQYDWVTAEHSDWSWDAYYLNGINVSRCSGSSYLKNCYSYATDAPTPMGMNGWVSWTVNSDQCELTSKKKSYRRYGADHAIVITGIHTYDVSPCNVTSTSEKNCSGGVYNINYTGMGSTGNSSGPVRKRK